MSYYGASGTAINRNEAGNYVWGAALTKFCFSTGQDVRLAHFGTMYLEEASRPNRRGTGWGLRDITSGCHSIDRHSMEHVIPALEQAGY